jgi:hypothetical protein
LQHFKKDIYGERDLEDLAKTTNMDEKIIKTENIINQYTQSKEYEILNVLDLNLNVPTGIEIFYRALDLVDY